MALGSATAAAATAATTAAAAAATDRRRGCDDAEGDALRLEAPRELSICVLRPEP